MANQNNGGYQGQQNKDDNIQARPDQKDQLNKKNDVSGQPAKKDPSGSDKPE